MRKCSRMPPELCRAAPLARPWISDLKEPPDERLLVLWRDRAVGERHIVLGLWNDDDVRIVRRWCPRIALAVEREMRAAERCECRPRVIVHLLNPSSAALWVPKTRITEAAS